MTASPSSAVARAHPVATAVATPELAASGQARASLRARPRRRGFALAVADVAGFVVAGSVAAWSPWAPWAHHRPWQRWAFVALSSAVLFGVLALRGRYGQKGRALAPRVADDVAPLVTALAVSAVCLVALGRIGFLAPALPPAAIGVDVALSVGTVLLFRASVLVLASRHAANVTRVVVVGSGFIAGYLADRLSRSRLVQFLGTVDDRPLPGHLPLGTLEDLPRLCASGRVDRVVIAFSDRHPARAAEILHELRGLVQIDVVVRYFELASWSSRLSDVTGLALVDIGRTPGRAASAAKRLIDVVVALSVLLATSPLLAVVAVAVRAESSGPALFRQERVGRHRRSFRILKFRTMVERCAPGRPADGGDIPTRTPFDATPDHDRITRIGKVLRRTGIDELPQLVNVLRGEMSLVGPRPFVPEECAGLGAALARRFDVRPGMTGMWQVCGQHEVSVDELQRLDIQYATSWSLVGDVRILARTPGRLVRGSAPGR